MEVFAVFGLVCLAVLLCVLKESKRLGESATPEDAALDQTPMMIFVAASCAFPALSFACKELCFFRFPRWRVMMTTGSDPVCTQNGPQMPSPGYESKTENQLSVFAVTTVASTFSLVFVVPLLLLTGQGPYFWDGFARLIENTDYAATAYISYLVINTIFNTALVLLVGYGSALTMFLSLKMVVPATAILEGSGIDWPIIGVGTAGGADLATWAILVAMLGCVVLFRLGNLQRDKLVGYYECMFPLRQIPKDPTKRSKDSRHGWDTPCKSPAPRSGSRVH